MGRHDEVARPGILGELDGQRRRRAALFLATLEDEANAVGMGALMLEGFVDGALELGSAVGIEQAQEGGRGTAEVRAALGEEAE